MNALTVLGYFFRQRDAISELIQRSNSLLKRIQYFHGSIRRENRKADITDDFPNLHLCLLRDFNSILLWQLLHLPFQLYKHIRRSAGFVCFLTHPNHAPSLHGS